MASLEQNIQKWVTLDNRLKELSEQVKELRDERNGLEENIINYANKNNLSKAIINISDGKLKFVDTKTTQPISLSFLEKCLREIVSNEEQVNKIMDYIKQKRETKVTSEIKRYYNN